jgi:pyruvate-ferredoxin/flavodoxin oxidoreductase
VQRRIRLFSCKLSEGYGDSKAERVVVLMGSAAMTAEEVVEYPRKHGERIGILKVQRTRPFSYKLG